MVLEVGGELGEGPRPVRDRVLRRLRRRSTRECGSGARMGPALDSAAATTWIVRGDWVAAPPRPATWIFRGSGSRLRRGSERRWVPLSPLPRVHTESLRERPRRRHGSKLCGRSSSRPRRRRDPARGRGAAATPRPRGPAAGTERRRNVDGMFMTAATASGRHASRSRRRRGRELDRPRGSTPRLVRSGSALRTERKGLRAAHEEKGAPRCARRERHPKGGLAARSAAPRPSPQTSRRCPRAKNTRPSRSQSRHAG